MTADTFTIYLAGGRQVEVLAAGPEDGLPLVFHNGTPVGPVAYAPMIEAASQRGLRLVICARPGYGDSTPRPGRAVADVTGDVAAVLDELGAPRFVTVGRSGGGPHALACAARLPERCLAAASVAGVAPYRVDGLDWLAGMGPENVAEFGAVLAGAEALTAYLEPEAAKLAVISGPVVADELGGLISPADRAFATGEFADYLAASFRAAVRTGIAGWRDDDLAFAADWGFTMAAAGAGAPVAVWQGDQDSMVPFAHGQWLAAHIPGVRAHLLPGEGHLTLAASFGAVLDDLLDMAGRTAAW
jgi:pimeloyl-ACP methyl ester carboxylesterase